MLRQSTKNSAMKKGRRKRKNCEEEDTQQLQEETRVPILSAHYVPLYPRELDAKSRLAMLVCVCLCTCIRSRREPYLGSMHNVFKVDNIGWQDVWDASKI